MIGSCDAFSEGKIIAILVTISKGNIFLSSFSLLFPKFSVFQPVLMGEEIIVTCLRPQSYDPVQEAGGNFQFSLSSDAIISVSHNCPAINELTIVIFIGIIRNHNNNTCNVLKQAECRPLFISK